MSSARGPWKYVLLSVAVAVLAVGCGGGGGSDATATDAGSTAAPADTGTGAGAGTDPSTGSGSADQAEAVDRPAWMTLPVTDVDGETFTIASLQGQPVFVENFATWCSNCRKQLGMTQEAAANAGDDAVFVALSVETDLDPGDVADYAADNGFDDIRFAVMSPEMLAAMDDAFGKTSLNPPSTPKVVVAADGTPGEMVTGFEEPDAIAEALAGS